MLYWHAVCKQLFCGTPCVSKYGVNYINQAGEY